MLEQTPFSTISDKKETEHERFLREVTSSNTLSEFQMVKKPVDFHLHKDLRKKYHQALIRVVDNHLDTIRDFETLEMIRKYLERNGVITSRVRVKLEQIGLRMAFGRR